MCLCLIIPTKNECVKVKNHISSFIDQRNHCFRTFCFHDNRFSRIFMNKSLDFSQILFALSQEKIVHEFYCEPQYLEIDDSVENKKKIIELKIKDGKTTIRIIKKKPENQESLNFEKKGHVANNQVDGDFDDKTKSKLILISNAIKYIISKMYYSTKIDYNFSFGIYEEKIYMLPDSSCSVELLNESDDDEFLSKFTDFYVDQINKPIDLSYCCCHLPDCSAPDYNVLRSNLILYNAINEFPKVKKSVLKELISKRTFQSDSTLRACIRCISKIQSACHETVKESEIVPELNAAKFVEFRALVPAEQYILKKKKLPVGLTPKMNKPFSFSLNLEKSPYKNAIPMKKRPNSGIYPKVLSISCQNPSATNRLIGSKHAELRTASSLLSQRPWENKSRMKKGATIQQLKEEVSELPRRSATKANSKVADVYSPGALVIRKLRPKHDRSPPSERPPKGEMCFDFNSKMK